MIKMRINPAIDFNYTRFLDDCKGIANRTIHTILKAGENPQLYHLTGNLI
jgi:hypothetical protein